MGLKIRSQLTHGARVEAGSLHFSRHFHRMLAMLTWEPHLQEQSDKQQ